MATWMNFCLRERESVLMCVCVCCIMCVFACCSTMLAMHSSEGQKLMRCRWTWKKIGPSYQFVLFFQRLQGIEKFSTSLGQWPSNVLSRTISYSQRISIKLVCQQFYSNNEAMLTCVNNCWTRVSSGWYKLIAVFISYIHNWQPGHCWGFHWTLAFSRFPQTPDMYLIQSTRVSRGSLTWQWIWKKTTTNQPWLNHQASIDRLTIINHC